MRVVLALCMQLAGSGETLYVSWSESTMLQCQGLLLAAMFGKAA